MDQRGFWGLLALIVMVGGATSLVLQGRQTPQVINALAGGFSNALSVAMGGSPGGGGLSVNGLG